MYNNHMPQQAMGGVNNNMPNLADLLNQNQYRFPKPYGQFAPLAGQPGQLGGQPGQMPVPFAGQFAPPGQLGQQLGGQPPNPFAQLMQGNPGQNLGSLIRFILQNRL